MAEVKMDLQELKALEDQLSIQRKNAKDLQLVVNEKDKEIATIKADKRTVRTTIKLEPENSYCLPTYPDQSEGLKKHFLLKVREVANFFWKGGHRSAFHEQNGESLIREVTYLADRFLSELKRYDSPSKVTGPTYKETKTTEYINFEDVKTEILAKLEGDVADEVARYKKEIATLKDTLTNSGVISDKRVKDINDKYQNEINEIVTSADKRYADLLKRYNELMTDKEEKSFERQIEELQEALAYEKAKKWYQKFKK